MSTVWNRRVFLRASAAAAAAGATAMSIGNAAAAPSPKGHAGRLRVERTTVEYVENLLGTDSRAPHLTWELAAGGNGARQTAYQIRVAPDVRKLSRQPMWDTGRVVSDRSVNVPYAGPALKVRTRYYWQVRVWDERGRLSPWSATRWWETALPADGWAAQWIGADAPPAPPGLDGASWIWSKEASPSGAPVGPRWFRAALRLPSGAEVLKANVTATADDDFTLHIGGHQVLHAPEKTDSWRVAATADVTEQVQSAGGRVVLAAIATNRGSSGNPAGLLVRLQVETSAGTQELVTDGGWRASDAERSGWERPDFDDSAWAPANALAPYGEGPWGKGVSLGLPELPAPLLRQSFTVRKPVVRARLYISGMAYYDAEINGTRVGRQVLDPGFTDYDETVLYAVHDVTKHIEHGANAIGVTLGRGFFGMTTPNVWNWHTPPWHGEPRLLAQLEMEHPDGTRTTVASGPDWRITDGPTLSNSLYAGETYDARKAPRGWTKAGFNDRAWPKANVQTAPKGVVRAQPHDPIEIVETIRPKAITELSPGVYIVDMGRTLAGWTRLEVTAAAGTTIRLVHGEKLKADGSVHAETGHVPGRFQTDEYIARGVGKEVWEPKFSYKGFRYVQISGLPQRPAAKQVVGRWLHTRVDEVSEFRCSEPFYEKLDAAMRRTLLNNMHGIPTDTPMFEKNGWTGDAQLGAPVMAYAFGAHRFLSKWLGDLSDSQKSNGHLPVIVPSAGWGYNELGPSPEWTTVYPFVIREMYRIYGDDRLAKEHWPKLTRYLDWEIGRLENGLAVTALGDFLAPGHGGNPPEDTRLTATAYLHRALLHTAEMGDVLGEKGTAARYRGQADQLKSAFNAEFFDSASGHYRTARDPEYRQTSNAVPLAFGLAPVTARADIAKSLVADVAARGNHLNTGALGTSVLLPALTSEGYPEVAHAIATQRTYPSWGYWFDNGADTMWEMWDLDSRSRDHYFHGTVVQWLYENVAGLRPGDAGYRTFTVRPDAREGVDWARTSIRTVRGRASVQWSRSGSGLRMTVQVPVGSEAEVHVPTARPAGVVSPSGAKYVGSEGGHAVYRVSHGSWEFVAK